MAIAKVKGLDRLKKSLNNMVLKQFVNKRLLDTIGEFTRDRIRSFTRTGKSIVGSSPKSFKRLKQSTVEQRRRLGRAGKADKEFFSPGRSNLTMTGQLLKSLSFKSVVRDRTVDVFAKGFRTDGKADNKKVAEFVAKGGRPFIGLDDKGIKRVTAIVLKDIRLRIKREGF